MKEINNFKKIREFLKFENSDHFYFLQLIYRKKDILTKGSNNGDRTIREYVVSSLDYFNSKEEEIIAICKAVKCRAYINISRRSKKEVAFELNKVLAEKLAKNDYNLYRLYNSIANSEKTVPIDKYWFIDCDSQQEYEDVLRVLSSKELKPLDTEKIIFVNETLQGFHIITRSFDRNHFKLLLPSIEIKTNPLTLLYAESYE